MTFTNKDEKMVLFEPNFINDIRNYFKENNDATLVISSSKLINENIDSVFFNSLLDLNLNRLLITGSFNKNEGIDVFLKLYGLKELDNRSVDLEYDFSYFSNLEILRYSWNKNCQNISTLNKLEELSLWAYKPKSQDLTEISNLELIEELRFVQSSIKSLKGIENYKNLKTVSFLANKSLSLVDFSTVFETVEDLYIEGCKKIDHKKVVQIFPNIKKLTYQSNDDLDSLKPFLEGFKNLEFLNVAGTKIKESDNKYWKNYSQIKTLNFLDKKHHILKRKDFGL